MWLRIAEEGERLARPAFAFKHWAIVPGHGCTTKRIRPLTRTPTASWAASREEQAASHSVMFREK